MTDVRRRLAAEAVGTATLVAAVVGSGIMADQLTDDPAIALLCNAIPTGAILYVLITVLGPVSGAHFNPVVTGVFALRRGLPPRLALLYVVAQVIGGLAGTALAHAMFGLPVFEIASHVRSGPAQFLSEVVASFGLVTVILGGLRARPGAIPSLVGLYIVSAYWFTASTSFANPAVTIARALTDTFSGIAPTDVPAFIVAQVCGALLAYFAASWLWPSAEPASDRA